MLAGAMPSVKGLDEAKRAIKEYLLHFWDLNRLAILNSNL